MTQVPLENLTPRHREAYIRFGRGWRLRRIAAEWRTTAGSAGEQVKQARLARDARIRSRNIFLSSRCAMLRGSGWGKETGLQLVCLQDETRG